MSSFSHCLKKMGLSEHEGAILRGRIDGLKAEGYDAHQAALQALKDHIGELESNRAEAAKLLPPAAKAPEAPPATPPGPTAAEKAQAAAKAKALAQAVRGLQREAFQVLAQLPELQAAAKTGDAQQFEATVIDALGTWRTQQMKAADGERMAAIVALGQQDIAQFAAAVRKEALKQAPKEPAPRKLQNTGDDLRRHWELVKAELKAKNDAEGITGMNKVLASTARADQFAGVLGEAATPGAQKVLELARDATTPFKDWVTGDKGALRGMSGAVYGERYRQKGAGQLIEGFITGTAKLNLQTLEKRGLGPGKGSAIETTADLTVQQRLDLLAEMADQWLSHVRGLVDPLRGLESAENVGLRLQSVIWTESGASALAQDRHAWDPLKDEQLTQRGRDLRDAGIIERKGVEPFRPGSYQLGQLIVNENTVEGKAKVKQLVPPRLERQVREGLPANPRGTRNITPQQFKDTFGFADVGFGNWVMAKEDQAHLNSAYDAFHDLATFIGVDPKAIGFGGKLHFTLGALGHGAKAAATFHPAHPGPNGTVQVINLTKTQGDGTVAHEWFHALDHYLSTSRPGLMAMRELVQGLRQNYAMDLQAKAIAALRKDTFMRGNKSAGPLENAQNVLAFYRDYPQRGLGKTEYAKNAEALGKDYWGNDEEMRARAWEAHIGDNLGGTNNYLVNTAWSGDGMAQPPSYRGTPYPRGDERTAFSRWYKALTNSLVLQDGVPTLDQAKWDAAKPDDAQQFRDAIEATIADLPQLYAQLQTEDAVWTKMTDGYASLLLPGDRVRSGPGREGTVVAGSSTNPGRITVRWDGQDGVVEAWAKYLEREANVPAARAARAAAEAAAARDQAADNPAPQQLPQGNAPLDDAALERIFDAASEDLHAQAQENAVAPEPGAPGLAGTPTSENSDKFSQKAENPTATKLIGEAARQGVKGIDEALKGLTELFGKGRIQSFPGGFDEEKYAKALPHFRAALEAFQAAGKSLKDLFTLLIQNFGDGMKPYILRFAKDAQLTADLGQKPSATKEIATWVKGQLNRPGGNVGISWQALFQIANEAFGGTQAEGKYAVKDAYDAAEAGMNLWLLENGARLNEGPNSALALLKRMVDRLPTQTKRTEEQNEFQQFSTVPPLAYLANWVAHITPGETYLEPSAGDGGLAVFGQLAGARIVANELSSRRAAILREVLPNAQVFTENAEHINDVLPDEIKPTVVVMNPPFSATAGRMEGKRDTAIGAQHVLSALQRLQPGGRLVAIVGEGMAMDAPTFRDWWARIKSEYTVRANIHVDGAEYVKYGTTFNNRLLVIDKLGPTTAPIVEGAVKSYAELPALLQGVRDGRSAPATSSLGDQQQSPELGGATPAAGGVAGPDAAQRPPTGAVGPGGSEPAAGANQPGAAGGGSVPPAGGRPGAGDAGAGAVPGRRQPGRRDTTPGRAEGAGSDQGPTAGELSLGQAQAQQAQQALTDSVFEDYTPRKAIFAGSKPHPGLLVESAAMAAVDAPDVSYVPNLPKSVITSGQLSSAQLEGVTYAGQAHAQMLPPATITDPVTKVAREVTFRRGFFDGDGTGVGKGRIIAGIIMDNWRQGRKKALWMSKSADLFTDATRDYTGIGGDESHLFKLGSTALDGTVKRGNGIMFTTYTTLRQEGEKDPANPKAPAPMRLQQVVDWLGKDFDGAIIFDESHNLKNSTGQSASQMALKGVELQELLPNARISYFSATGATEVSNLLYTRRLGLWGPQTSFADANTFVSEIESKGLAAMELVARDMKGQGSYIARSLSFDGVHYEQLDASLTPLQQEIYNELAQAWQIVLQNIDAALKDTNQHKNASAKSRALSLFWASQQRFFNQVVTSMSMPSILERAQAELANGNAVVFQLVNTNEAIQERAAEAAAAAGTALEELDFTPRQILTQMVEKAYPTQKYEQYRDPATGTVKSRPVLNSKGEPVIDREQVAKRDALLKKLEDIRVPDNPLDLILEALGDKNVAEVTGRARRFVPQLDRQTGDYKMVEQKRSGTANKADAKAFMDDKKRALIFSDAGGTGFSYHSSNEVANQRQRIHFLVQPGWSAANAVQGFGRTHRSNEANQPTYILPRTNLKAQKRFISSIARRLDQLGALTKGQRNTTSQGLFTNRDNLESKYAIAAMRSLLEDMAPGHAVLGTMHDPQAIIKAMGLEGIYDPKNQSIVESKMPKMTRFLNRLLSLTVDQQDQVFSEFEQRMDAATDAAVQAGTYDDGMQTVKGVATTQRDEVVYTDPRTGAKTHYLELSVERPTILNNWDDVEQQLQAYRGKGAGYYFDNQTQHPFAMVDLGAKTGADGKLVHRGYRIDVQAPNGSAVRGRWITNVDSIKAGGDRRHLKREDGTEAYRPRYERMTLDQAEYQWGETLQNAPRTYTEPLNLVTGAILPVWERLKAAGQTPVVRVQTATGERYIGMQIPDETKAAVLKNFGLGNMAADVPASELVSRILAGEVAQLSNGWTIRKVQLSGEARLEITGAYFTSAQLAELERQGAIRETIQYRNRVFIPVNQPDVFERITRGANRPVVDMLGAGAEGKLSIGGQFVKGTPAAEVQAVVDRLNAQWRNAPPITVVQHVNELPRPAPLKARGMIYQGHVYLVASNLKDAQAAQFVLLHETAGHYGLAGVFGDELNPLLRRIYDSNDQVRLGADQRQAYYRANGREISLELATEETLADMAGKGTVSQLNGWQLLVAAIRRALRSLGFDLAMSDNDVADLLRQARQYVERPAATLAPLASSADRAEPAFQAQEPRFTPAQYAPDQWAVKDLHPQGIGIAAWFKTREEAEVYAKLLNEKVGPAFNMDRPPFYSALAVGITRAPFAKDGTIPAAQLKSWVDARIKDGAFKQAEVEWSGLGDYLDMVARSDDLFDGTKGRISRDRVTSYLLEMGVRVEETLLREAPENEQREPEMVGVDDNGDAIYDDGTPPGGTQFAAYTLPGGQNYRELLLHLPAGNDPVNDPEYQRKTQALIARAGDQALPVAERDQAQAELRALVRENYERPETQAIFRSSHFDQTNILVHLRFNERTDAAGKRVLFIEEIQSDWAQVGRRKGFAASTAGWTAHLLNAPDAGFTHWQINDAHGNYVTKIVGGDKESAIRKAAEGVPTAPFVTDTKAWVALALKRAIRYAAENGLDRIAWTTGEQQADRYDLSKHVERIEWTDEGPADARTVVARMHQGPPIVMGVSRNTGKVLDGTSETMGKTLDEIIGKDLAQRVLEAPDAFGQIKDVDLRIGGQGMYAFYDKIVPQVARELLRKLGGGELGQVQIGRPSESPAESLAFRASHPEIYGAEGATSAAEQRDSTISQPGFDLTDAMKAKALDGLPLFSLPTDGMAGAALQYVQDHISSPKSFGVLKPFMTQLHKALTQPHFRPVYQAIQRFLLDTSRYANEAADRAGDILPRLQDAKEIFSLKDLTPTFRRNLEAAGKVTFLATLADIRPTDEQLARGFDVTDPNTGSTVTSPALNPEQIRMWHQARAAIDLALDQVAASEMIKLTADDGIDGARADARLDPEHAQEILGVALEPQVAPLRDRAQALADLAAEAKVEAGRLKQEIKNEADPTLKANLRAERREVMKDLLQKNRAATAADTAYQAKKASLDGIKAFADRAQELKDKGYAPLMRFGQFTVNVTMPGEHEGTRKEVFFSMYRNRAQANEAARAMQEEFGPEAFVTTGTMDEASFKLYRGLSLDALAAFANVTGLSAKQEFQEFYKLALSSRSALKRLIHRKGIAGYEEDLPRVLAGFLTANARLASRNIHMGEAVRAQQAIPTELGQLRTEAANLIHYVQNPEEEAQTLRGFLFINFIGGSIASAAVNATQPVTMTAPWLSQYSNPLQAVRALAGAVKIGLHGIPGDEALRNAMELAASEGITEPQEIHQLYAESIRNGFTNNIMWRKFNRVWGGFFSAAESFNRRITFAAAWRLADDVGIDAINAVRAKIGLPAVADSFDFARTAVDETQGVYNKGNRPNASRGEVGAVLFTFKQFSIAYIEFLARLPAREKALAVAILVAASGVQGLPGADELEDLVDALGQMMGFSTNSKKAVRHWAMQHLGTAAGAFMNQGVSQIPGSPFDASQRLGFNGIVPGLNLLKRSDENRPQALGAADSFADQLLRGWHLAEEHQFGLAAQATLPIAIQNGMKAADMWASGYYRDLKGRRVVPVSGRDALFKLIGFQPYTVADASQAAGEVLQDVALEKNVEGGIVDRMARARVDGDPAGFASALSDLQAWNARNPGNMIRITPEQMASHVKNLLMERKLRIIKAAPPEARAGAIRDLQ